MATSYLPELAKFGSQYKVTCHDKDGNLKWVEDNPNLVVDEGIYYLFDVAFFGSEERADWYCSLFKESVGLIRGPQKTDTMLSHDGWSEYTGWVNWKRPIINFKHPNERQTTTSLVSDPLQFIIGDNNVVNGCFMVTHDNKGIDSIGKLYGVSSFSSPRSVSPGDAINIVITLGGVG